VIEAMNRKTTGLTKKETAATTGSDLANADRPIRSASEDQLGRARFAKVLAAQISRMPQQDSSVLALQGAWGSGKSSVLNMVAELLRTDQEPHVIFNFNPWFFSSQEELIQRFFAELAGMLLAEPAKRLKSLGKSIAAYGDAVGPLGGVLSLVPGVGKALEGAPKALKFAGKLIEERSGAPGGDVQTQRGQLEELLLKSGQRFVVLVDDVDRLDRAELREIFRLVRLVADFPCMTYVLAFDRPSVARILNPADPDEADRYLEKIVQAAIDLPEVDGELVRRMVAKEIQRAVEELPEEWLDHQRWPDCFGFALLPLFETPRDVRRYANLLELALGALAEEVTLVDLLVLEAVRAAAPRAYQELVARRDVIATAPDDYVTDGGWDHRKKAIEEALKAIEEAAGSRAEPIRHVCRLLFPATRAVTENMHYGSDSAVAWRRDRRVAHSEVFEIYVQYDLPPHVVSQATVTSILRSSIDDAMEAVSRVPDERLQSLYGRMAHYEGRVPPERVPIVAAVMMEAFHRLPEANAMFEVRPDILLGRVLLRLIRPIETEARRAAIATGLVSSVQSLSATLELVTLVGHHENAGHKLVSELEWRSLEALLARRVRDSTPGRLAQERDLAELLDLASGLDEPPASAEWVISLLEQDEVFLALIGSALRVGWSSSLGSLHERTDHDLPWPALIRLVGEVLLVRRVREVLARRRPKDQDDRTRAGIALRVAQEYVDGRRRPGSSRDGRPDASD
jgi:predicted KAP-like P-loop ATPase